MASGRRTHPPGAAVALPGRMQASKQQSGRELVASYDPESRCSKLSGQEERDELSTWSAGRGMLEPSNRSTVWKVGSIGEALVASRLSRPCAPISHGTGNFVQLLTTIRASRNLARLPARRSCS